MKKHAFAFILTIASSLGVKQAIRAIDIDEINKQGLDLEEQKENIKVNSFLTLAESYLTSNVLGPIMEWIYNYNKEKKRMPLLREILDEIVNVPNVLASIIEFEGDLVVDSLIRYPENNNNHNNKEILGAFNNQPNYKLN